MAVFDYICKNGEKIQICRLEKKHIPSAVLIEGQCFSNPWSERSFNELIDLCYVHSIAAFDENQNLLGYLIASFVLDTAEILNIAVDKNARLLGIGNCLMEQAERFMRENGVAESFLEVRVSNTAARCLYKKNGYVELSRRRNYYTCPREDAIIMKKIF